MKTIVWDVDDVLNELTFSWFKDCAESTLWDRNLRYEDLVVNPPHTILGITLDEYLKSLDDYRLSKKGRDLPPNNEVLEWFNANGFKYRHIALTARSRKTVHVLSDWVLRYYGDWIRSFSFIPAPRQGEKLPVYHTNKAEYLSWFGKADFFIDDSYENIQAAQDSGVKSFLFPRPWNNSNLTPGLIFEKIGRSV